MNLQQIYEFLLSTLVGFVQSTASYAVILTVVYLLIWQFFASQFKRFRIQPVKRAGSTQIREEIKNSIISLLGGLITTPLILILQQMGYTKIYIDPTQYGLVYLIISALLLFVLADARI